jgi:hypothetical protein
MIIILKIFAAVGLAFIIHDNGKKENKCEIIRLIPSENALHKKTFEHDNGPGGDPWQTSCVLFPLKI